MDKTPHLVYRNASSEIFHPMKLHFAINKHDIEQVKSLVNDNVNLDFKIFNQTPLEVAINHESFDIACFLIENGASLDFITSSKPKLTPLQLASNSGCVQLVKKILEIKEDLVNVRDSRGMTALHWAGLKNHLEVARVLVSKGADVDLKDDYEMTPLFHSVFSNNIKVVETFIELGANVNESANEGYTPLMKACSSNRYNIAKSLIVKGHADPNITDHNGNSCLHKTCLWSQDDFMNFSQFFSESLSSLPNFNKSQEVLVRLLLNHGADVDLANANSLTPLSISISKHAPSITCIFLDAGASCSLEDLSRLHDLELSASRPRSLFHLCKKAIRRCLASFIDEKIHQLDLPLRLKDFLQV